MEGGWDLLFLCAVGICECVIFLGRRDDSRAEGVYKTPLSRYRCLCLCDFLVLGERSPICMAVRCTGLYSVIF